MYELSFRELSFRLADSLLFTTLSFDDVDMCPFVDLSFRGSVLLALLLAFAFGIVLRSLFRSGERTLLCVGFRREARPARRLAQDASKSGLLQGQAERGGTYFELCPQSPPIQYQ